MIKETQGKAEKIDPRINSNDPEKKLKGVSFVEEPGNISGMDQGKVNDNGRGVLKPMNERDFQVPFHNADHSKASASGTKDVDEGIEKEKLAEDRNTGQNRDPRLQNQNGTQSVCEKARMTNVKDNERERVKITYQTRPENTGFENNRGNNKGKGMQMNQGNQWNLGRKATALFNVEPTKRQKVNTMPSASETGRRGDNLGKMQSPLQSNVWNKGGRVEKSEGEKEKVENVNREYEGERGRQKEGQQNEFVRGGGRGTLRGRGGREGFRGGRGGAAGRGSLNSKAEVYEKVQGKGESEGGGSEHWQKVQKQLFKKNENQEEGLEKRKGQEVKKGKGGVKGSYFGVLPVDVDGDMNDIKVEWDPGDAEEEGEIIESDSEDEDYTASIEKSEEEEEIIREKEVEEENDRMLKGMNATPTKLTRAQKKKIKKNNKRSGGKKAEASMKGGGGQEQA
nr:hypothetical protein Iba_contig2331CG0010 [Ipomoea batatas]